MDRPLVQQSRNTVAGADTASRVRRVAEILSRQNPSLAIHPALSALSPRHLGQGGSLIIDDTQGISLVDRYFNCRFLQDRARLRADDGDTVVTATPAAPAFERYCNEQLQLGHPEWLHSVADSGRHSLAASCWRDRPVRESLVERIRDRKLNYLHPLMGDAPVWALAKLLSQKAGRELQVIAPHPALTTAVNNKVWFTRVVSKLLGNAHLPCSRPANSYSGLASLARQMGQGGSKLVIKLPDSAGGAGNLVLGSSEVRNQGLCEVQRLLRKKLEPLGWNGHKPLLVSRWEADVLSTPSVQAWIPPLTDGHPVIEGVFEQMVDAETGIFEGSYPAHLPRHLHRALLHDSLVLSELFQLLGYLGRCSFDTIMVGHSAQRARIEFIECNGRWGGTSLPMSLANRLFGNWRSRPYATRELSIPGLRRYRFEDLQRFLKTQMYDARTDRGWLVLYSPGLLRANSGIDVLCLGKSQAQANQRAREILPRHLARLGAQSPNLTAPGSTHGSTHAGAPLQ